MPVPSVLQLFPAQQAPRLVGLACRSRAQNLPTAGAQADEVTEALVPGLDFCNHAAGPTCRWELQGDQVQMIYCLLASSQMVIQCSAP